jgi:hypothetical protein
MAKAVMPLAVLERAFGPLRDTEMSQFVQRQTMQYLGGAVAV